MAGSEFDAGSGSEKSWNKYEKNEFSKMARKKEKMVEKVW